MLNQNIRNEDTRNKEINNDILEKLTDIIKIPPLANNN